MSTYVFAHSGRALALLALSADPFKDHADFSVMHYRGRIPLIADPDLDILRSFEDRDRLRRERAAAKKSAKRRGDPLEVGTRVKLSSGAWSGWTGIVEKSNGRFTLLTIDRKEVKIDTFLISPSDIESASTHKGAAA